MVCTFLRPAKLLSPRNECFTSGDSRDQALKPLRFELTVDRFGLEIRITPARAASEERPLGWSAPTADLDRDRENMPGDGGLYQAHEGQGAPQTIVSTGSRVW